MTCRVSLPVLALTLVAAISGAPSAQEALGRIDFSTSGAAAAQPAFLKGVLLLHSFEYDDAKEAFVEAQQLDPAFAMAYWGEAMTYNHPVWQQTAPDLARAALNKLAPSREARQGRAATQKEKDWLASLEALYGPGEKLQRDVAYAEALARMYKTYPDDLEVASFYALAILGTSHGGRDFATYMRAAALVEEVYRRNPQHPGAAHYLIHAYDDPIHAPLGLRYADAYGRIAPAASHALHMPSHIYFAIGMWDEAAAMNERSVKAADDRVAAKKLDVDARGFHALHWLAYTYVQQGRYRDARGVIDQIDAAAAKSGSVRTRSHLALARAAWLIDTRRWADAASPVQAKGLGGEATAADLFAIGWAAFRRGDRLAANDALQQMALLAGDGDRPVPSAPTRPGVKPVAPAKPAPSIVPPTPAPAGSHTAHMGTQGQPQTGLPAAGAGGDKRVPAVMAQLLEAGVLFAEGRRDEAVILAKQAAVVEDTLSFEFGPPVPVKPAHEVAGELFLDMRRYADAQREFEASLKRAPRRTLSLLGLFRAATAAKDVAAARRAAEELRQIWHRADKTLPELKELGITPSS